MIDTDLHLFNEGRLFKAYERLGAHVLGNRGGVRFAVWAPNAAGVSVAHEANRWLPGSDPLEPLGDSGIWAGDVDSMAPGTAYKYWIAPRDGEARYKADPVGFGTEVPPLTASVVTDLSHDWADREWMTARDGADPSTAPMSIYEVHLGSWRRRADGEWLSYDEIAPLLADYVRERGFTHVELLPVMEHPYYGSWGYQSASYFAPSARFGHPTGLMRLIDHLHQSGIGVILDWVPSHFATDSFGLGEFDGTHLFEHEDPLQRKHPDWGSYEFNYGRHEVRSFLISSAWFWLDLYHADGLRVDAVASMLYLDYSRSPGQWVPNRYGGRENLDAVSFLQQFNESVHERFTGVVTIAEESTAWPGVTTSTADGGLGFSMKWDMGWMHDTLEHLEREPIHRRFHYNELTFRGLYAFSERFVLPLSHDEVVHGKGSLVMKMPGDDWQERANLRLLLASQWFQPGKKLLFMGNELATWREWDHESELDWALLGHPGHAGIAQLVSDLNRLYRERRALQRDFDPAGFAWTIADDAATSVLAWRRMGDREGDEVLVIMNLTPIVRDDYRVGVSVAGLWAELLNTDAEVYGGSGVGNVGGAPSQPVASHGFASSLVLTLPPLGALLLGAPEGGSAG